MSIADKLTQIAENTPKVYEAGYEKGKAEGSDRVFWDIYLQNGKRENYGYAFAGEGWTDETFQPNHDMVVKNASYLFPASKIGNLKALLEAQGVTMDFSQCTLFTYAFGMSQITDIGAVDVRSSSGSVQYFLYNNQRARTFEKLIIDENVAFTNTAFQFASALEEIRLEGLLGQNGLDFQWSKKLSKDSITSIINALSPTATGKTVTLSKTAVENAFPSEEVIPLYPYYDTTKTDGGITYTHNGDGSITINGQNEAETYFFANGSIHLPKGTYEFSFPSTENYSQIMMYCEVTKSTGEYQEVWLIPNKTQTITVEDNETSTSIMLMTGYMADFNNTTVTPTIKKIETWDELVATKPNWTISLV